MPSVATACQRWREGRESYRPARETINRREFDVALIPPEGGDTIAREFVEEHHYSGSYPAARERFGFYRFGSLVGVAVFSHPTNDRALTDTFSNIDRLAGVKLGRLVLLDEVGANGESFFVARCFELLRRDGYRGVISCSDPIPRRSRLGDVVMPGHVGTVYQALNARFVGRTTARTLRLLPDGTVLSDRTLQKIRAGERGWQAAVAQLEAFGAPGFDGDPREWVRRVLPTITTTVRHPGNYKYVWGLDRRVALPESVGPYPKVVRT
jgi:hypothetical protein